MDWVVGGIVLAVIAFYCYILFYPKRCSKIVPFSRSGRYNIHTQNFKSHTQAYGRVKAIQVEDEFDNIELAVAFKDSNAYTDNVEGGSAKDAMEHDLKETMF